MSALTNGQHGRYLDDAGMLGIGRYRQRRQCHSRAHPRLPRRQPRVATNAASATGIGPDVLKRMLPVVATLAMGALAKQAATQRSSPASLAARR